MERFCQHHRYEIVQRSELNESAGNGGKDGGEYPRALRQAQGNAWAGKCEVLIVWALDRVTREGAEGALRIIRQVP